MKNVMHMKSLLVKNEVNRFTVNEVDNDSTEYVGGGECISACLRKKI
jgi:hypothetical protein